MALGDADLRVFFRQGDTVQFNGVSSYPDGQPVQANVEQQGKNAQFGSLEVEDDLIRMELPWNAFSPFPEAKQQITVLSGRLAGTYKIRNVDPLDDGATVELKLEQTT